MIEIIQYPPINNPDDLKKRDLCFRISFLLN